MVEACTKVSDGDESAATFVCGDQRSEEGRGRGIGRERLLRGGASSKWVPAFLPVCVCGWVGACVRACYALFVALCWCFVGVVFIITCALRQHGGSPGAVTTAVVGGLRSYQNIQQGKDIHFHPLCGRE